MSHRSLKQSSYDTTGGNSDRWPIAAGAVREVFNADGPGVITHIWFTIAARSADHLKELVLRGYRNSHIATARLIAEAARATAAPTIGSWRADPATSRHAAYHAMPTAAPTLTSIAALAGGTGATINALGGSRSRLT